MVGKFQCRIRVAKTSEGAAGFFFVTSPYVCAKSGGARHPLFAQTYGEVTKKKSGRPFVGLSYTNPTLKFAQRAPAHALVPARFTLMI